VFFRYVPTIQLAPKGMAGRTEGLASPEAQRSQGLKIPRQSRKIRGRLGLAHPPFIFLNCRSPGVFQRSPGRGGGRGEGNRKKSPAPCPTRWPANAPPAGGERRPQENERK
jgi:hypothetical protein